MWAARSPPWWRAHPRAHLPVSVPAKGKVIMNTSLRAMTTSLAPALKGKALRRVFSAVGIIVAAIVIGVAGSGSTYALWNGSKPIGATTLSAGSTGLTVNGVTTYTVPGLNNTQILPGLSAVSPQVLTIFNAGSTPLSVTVGTPTFADPSSLLAQNGNLVVSLFQSANCAQSVDGSSATAWTAPLVLAAGGSVTACLQMTLSANAPSTVQGLSATFTLPLIATQVRNQ